MKEHPYGTQTTFLRIVTVFEEKDIIDLKKGDTLPDKYKFNDRYKYNYDVKYIFVDKFENINKKEHITKELLCDMDGKIIQTFVI